MPPLPLTPDQAVAIVNNATSQVSNVVSTVATQLGNVAQATATGTSGMTNAATALKDAITSGSGDINRAIQQAIGEIQRLGSQAERALRDLIAQIPQIEIPAEIKINGIAVASPINPDELYRKLLAAIEAPGRAPVTIHVEGPLAGLLTPLTMTPEDRRKFALGFAGLPPTSVLLTPNPAEWVIVAIVICICVVVIALGLGGPLVVGTGAILFALAVALIIAAVQGRKIAAEVCPDLGVAGALFSDIMAKVNLKTCVNIKID